MSLDKGKGKGNDSINTPDISNSTNSTNSTYNSNAFPGFTPSFSTDALLLNTFYLSEINSKYERIYAKKEETSSSSSSSSSRSRGRGSSMSSANVAPRLSAGKFV